MLTTQPDLLNARSGDYNGDGKSDILWRNATTGANSIWLSANSATKQAVATVSDTTCYGRFRRLHRRWARRHPVAQQRHRCEFAGRRPTSTLKQVLAEGARRRWKVAGSGDYNGDGKSDILWRNATTGADSIWLSANSATKQAVATISDTTWQVAGSGDYTGDGRADILWRNSVTGANSLWPSANQSLKQVLTAQPDLAWSVVGSVE
ncbi:MAG: VCBS repeat-containing protein [Lysobacterales bacterium]